MYSKEKVARIAELQSKLYVCADQKRAIEEALKMSAQSRTCIVIYHKGELTTDGTKVDLWGHDKRNILKAAMDSICRIEHECKSELEKLLG